MKKLFIILAVTILTLTSCVVKDGETILRTEYKVVILDDCEYIIFSGGNTGYFAHKGNCNNPIHEHNQ